MDVCGAAHAPSQAPQWSGSELVSTQLDPQGTVPGGHVETHSYVPSPDLTHWGAGSEQRTSQPPQLPASAKLASQPSASPPEQSANPSSHSMSQVPPRQTGAAWGGSGVQASPQRPQ